MARKKKKRRKLRRRKERAQGLTRPTPETKQKLRSDNLLSLYKHGFISKDQRDAALDIREMVEALQSRFLKAANYELGPRGVTPGSHHPMEGFAEHLFYRFHNKYAPWRAAMHKARRVDGIAVLPCCYGIIVEGQGTRELDEFYAVKRGTTMALFKGAMDAYSATSRPYPAP